MYIPHINLTSLFLSICREFPDRVAIKDSGCSLTYRQTLQFAQQLAASLKEQQVAVGNRVVCIGRKDVETIVSFWGILLGGCIPVMLDEEDGEHVNIAKIKEVEAGALVLDKTRQPAVTAAHDIPLLELSQLCAARLSAAVYDTPDVSGFPDLCYILLTSGTTGKPKAVQILHSSVLHYAYAIYQRIGSPDHVVAAHVSTMAADLGLTNLLIALVAGGTLRVINKTEATDPACFNRIMEEEKVSLLKITPSHLISLIGNNIAPYTTPLDCIILGGEKLGWDVVDAIVSAKLCTKLFNHYGPTEATVGALAFHIDHDSAITAKTGSVPMGTPLGEGICFLENKEGDTGELYIGGPGISVGYLHNEAENERKFLVREFAGRKVRCYRTGDVCRQLSDGNYEFLYRTDRQVKVMGHRIELGEIELAIYARPEVAAVAADTSMHLGHPVIEVYIKLRKDATLDTEELRIWLQERLPKYKVPTVFNFYTVTPYNANGKLDLPALKASFRKDAKARESGGTKLHEISWRGLVSKTWMKVLGSTMVSPADNFFKTGGDSLRAIQFIGRLQRFGYKVSISDINNFPEFGKFLDLAPEKERNYKVSSQPVKKVQQWTISQHRLLEQKGFDIANYCQSILLQATEKISIRELALALKCLLEGHPQLGMYFQEIRGHFSMEKKSTTGIHLQTTVLDSEKPVVVQIQEVAAHLLKEISADRLLFSVHLFIDNKGNDYIYFLGHHLIIDVVSWHIIIGELFDYYEHFLSGNHPTIVPEDSLGRFFNEIEAGAEESKALLNGSVPQRIHRLPEQVPETDGQHALEVLCITIPEEISAALRFVDLQGTPSLLSGLLMYSFSSALLDEYSLPALTVDTEYHGRPRYNHLPDLSRSVAWWATTWPVHLEAAKLSVGYCSRLIHEKAAAANNINLLPPLINRKNRERPPDVKFNYLGYFPETFGNGKITLVPACFNPGSPRSMSAQQEYKISFTTRFIGNRMVADMQYDLQWCSGAKASAVAGRFFEILKNALRERNCSFDETVLPFMKSNMPSVGQPLYQLHSAIAASKPANIFLTGATGFLGIHLLHQLITQGARIINCLVRSGGRDAAAKRLKHCYEHYFQNVPVNWDKVVRVINGDLSESHFGLCAEDYQLLADETDVILHTGADVNLLRDYALLAQTNITGTRNVIELATAGKGMKIHFVSTLAVSGMPGDSIKRKFSEDDFDYGQIFISNYEKTKFEAEQLIREFINTGGQGRIYRVSHIAADSATGKFQKNVGDNRIFQVLKGMLLLRHIPDTYQEQLSFSYVDIVAQGIAAFCLEKIHADIRCVHMENPQCLPFTAVVQLLRQMGYVIDVVDTSAFKEKINNYEGPAGSKRDIDLMDTWIQRYLQTPRQIIYNNNRSVDMLATFGIYFPKADLQWFSRMIQKGISAGYFEPPAGYRNVASWSDVTDAMGEVQHRS